MSDQKASQPRNPIELGAPRAIRFNVEVRSGNGHWTPNRTLVFVDLPDWRCHIDGQDRLWLGHQETRLGSTFVAWSRIPWTSVDYVSYYAPGETPEKLKVQDHDTITDVRSAVSREPRSA